MTRNLSAKFLDHMYHYLKRMERDEKLASWKYKNNIKRVGLKLQSRNFITCLLKNGLVNSIFNREIKKYNHMIHAFLINSSLMSK